MQIVPLRTPDANSNGAALQSRWSNDNGYVNNPIENSSISDALVTASDSVRQTLKGVDLTNIKPSELAKMATTLFSEGQISGITAALMVVQQVDGDAPINALQVFQQQHAAIQHFKSSPFFSSSTAGYSEVESATNKLAEFIRAITSSSRFDMMA